MASFFSTISGQFSKSWILGVFLPVILFVVLFQALAVPLTPGGVPLFQSLEDLGPEWKAIALTFLALVLSGLLYNLNAPLIRLYEGYPWARSRWGRRRIRHYQAAYTAARAQRDGLPVLVAALQQRAAPKDVEIGLEIDRRQTEQEVLLNDSFPPDESWVLPTRLGNVIRSFESYPARQYGIEAIPLWPRLAAKVDKDYAVVIDDAKTSFDFVLNGSVLCALLSLALLSAGLWYGVPLTSPQTWLPWLLEIGLFLGLSRLLYGGAVGRAKAWGAVVKGAFDLYRWDLLKQLGYTRIPQNIAEERALWDSISTQMLYGDPPATDPVAQPDYALRPTRAWGIPSVIRLDVTRGILPAAGGILTVTLRVRNNDDDARSVADVTLIDTLPDGSDYVWGSALRQDESGAAQEITPLGANPYRFDVGTLGSGEWRLVTYRATSNK